MTGFYLQNKTRHLFYALLLNLFRMMPNFSSKHIMHDIIIFVQISNVHYFIYIIFIYIFYYITKANTNIK